MRWIVKVCIFCQLDLAGGKYSSQPDTSTLSRNKQYDNTIKRSSCLSAFCPLAKRLIAVMRAASLFFEHYWPQQVERPPKWPEIPQELNRMHLFYFSSSVFSSYCIFSFFFFFFYTMLKLMILRHRDVIQFINTCPAAKRILQVSACCWWFLLTCSKSMAQLIPGSRQTQGREGVTRNSECVLLPLTLY